MDYPWRLPFWMSFIERTWPYSYTCIVHALLIFFLPLWPLAGILTGLPESLFFSKLCMNYAWIMWIAWYFLVQIFIIKAFKNSLVLLLIPNYTFSKQKQGTEGCFAAKINRNRVLFLSQAVIGYTVLLPIMARVV